MTGRTVALVALVLAGVVLYGVSERVNAFAAGAIAEEQRASEAQFRAIAAKMQRQATALKLAIVARDLLTAHRPRVSIRIPAAAGTPAVAVSTETATAVLADTTKTAPDSATVTVEGVPYIVPRPVASAFAHFIREALASDTVTGRARELVATADAVVPVAQNAIDVAKKRPAWWRRTLGKVSGAACAASGGAVGAGISGAKGAAIGAAAAALVCSLR